MIPRRPLEPLPHDFEPSEADCEIAAAELFEAFCQRGDDRHGLEEIVVEVMVPQLIASMRACAGKGDGGLEMAPASELFYGAARRAVDAWDSAEWSAWRTRGQSTPARFHP